MSTSIRKGSAISSGSWFPDLAGRSNILSKAQGYGLDLSSKDPVVLEILSQLKELEKQGFQFEGAEGSFELLMNRALGRQKRYFQLLGFRVMSHKMRGRPATHGGGHHHGQSQAAVTHTASVGNGPVNALDNALRKALDRFFPELREVRLMDYKVRVFPCGRDRGTGPGADRVHGSGKLGDRGGVRRILWRPPGRPWWTVSLTSFTRRNRKDSGTSLKPIIGGWLRRQRAIRAVNGMLRLRH